jgi:hypothetical protein
VSQFTNKGKLPARFLGVATSHELLDDSKTADEAMNSVDRIQWEKAMSDELVSLNEHQTGSLVHLLPRKKALLGKWVFRKTLGPDGSISHFKAWWVVRGYKQ